MRHDLQHCDRFVVGDLTAQKFQFDEFTLDESRYSLRRGDWPVRLEKRPMELLLLLLERQGNLVTREEIASRLWGKNVFLDVDHSINTAIRKVRRALRDDPEKPRFIETVVGKGYRFAAPIVAINGDTATTAAAIPVAESAAAPAPSSFPLNLRVLAAAAVILVLVAAVFFFRAETPERAAAPSIRSLAVLPFKNISGDPQQEYFADGMTEAIIDRLSHIPALRVISPTSVMRLKNTTLSVTEIARALNVDGIVEGSFSKQGGRVRVTLQLVRGATGERVWSEDYDRESRTVPGLQEEVARTIAQRIQIGLAPQQQLAAAESSTVDPDVQEDYLKGRYYFNERTAESLNKAIGYFREAIARDPNYAYAYSGLADAYALLGLRGAYPAKDALAKAKAAALKALQLDSTLAEPHASLALIAEMYEWNWREAEREYKRALELSPGNASIHHLYAGYLMYVGRYADGIAEARLARDLDPLSLPVNNALAGRLLVAGRTGEALEQVRKTLELSPYFAPAHQTLGWVYLHSGKPADALREFQQAVQLGGPNDSDLLLDLGFADASVGKTQEARKILADFIGFHEQGRVPSASIAILYGALGERNEAFAWLNKAYVERNPELTYLTAGRRYAPLRNDPRFAELVRRVGLPE